MLAMQKFGARFSIKTAWTVGRIDDGLCSCIPGLRRFGSGVAPARDRLKPRSALQPPPRHLLSDTAAFCTPSSPRTQFEFVPTPWQVLFVQTTLLIEPPPAG